MVEHLRVGDLDLLFRRCKPQDIGFVYELMYHHLGGYFSRIAEGWSRQKFKEGFKPARITIVEHAAMPVGFYDYEFRDGFMYLHNLELAHDYQQRGVGTALLSHLCVLARRQGVSHLEGKIFKENVPSLCWSQKNGFRIAADLNGEESYRVVLNI